MDVSLRLKSYQYEAREVIKWNVEIYLEDDSEESLVIDSEVGGIIVGEANLYLYDANKHTPSRLRMDAYIAAAAQFEILSSVRIFSDEFDLDQWDGVYLDEGSLNMNKFEEEEIDSLQSWTEYDADCTENVYGRLISLDKIIINKEYRNQGIGTLAIEQIIKYFGNIGMDFLLLLPFPLDEERRQDDVLQIHKESLIRFYQKFGFKLTKGRLKNDYCLVKQIN